MKLKPFFTAIATGILLGLSFPPIPFPVLAFVAFIPMLYAMDNDKMPRQTFIYFYIIYFLYHGISNWWVGSWQDRSDPFLIASGVTLMLVHPFFLMIPAYILLYFKHKFPARFLWFFPFIQAAFDWAHAVGELSYPWLTIGNTQIMNRYWIQFIDITGIYGASFIVALINVVIYRFFTLYEVKRKFSKKKLPFRSREIWYSAAIMSAAIVLPYIYGFIQINNYDHDKLLKSNETMNIGLIQPNIDPWDKWIEGNVYGQIDMYKTLQDSLLNAVNELDLSIWCETAIPFLNYDFNTGRDMSILQNWVNDNNVSILTGLSYYKFWEKSENPPISARPLSDTDSTYFTAYNAAVMLNPGENSKPQIYKKMKMTPFSERIPYMEIVPFLGKWINWGVGISSWTLGDEQKPLTVNNENDSARIASIICIESVYPGFVENYNGMGTDVYSVITNDSWFDGTPGPRQHYQIAQIRAIENRRYIARAANSGITGFISAAGESLHEAEPYQRTGIAMTVPLINKPTVYSSIGNIIPVISGIFVIIMMIYGFIKKRYSSLSSSKLRI